MPWLVRLTIVCGGLWIHMSELEEGEEQEDWDRGHVSNGGSRKRARFMFSLACCTLARTLVSNLSPSGMAFRFLRFTWDKGSRRWPRLA